MKLYGNKFTSLGNDLNFNSFQTSFILMFQILTLENWQIILFECMKVGGNFLSSIFLISWIFIGNYILLNLFLAILLDGFMNSSKSSNEEFQHHYSLNDDLFR